MIHLSRIHHKSTHLGGTAMLNTEDYMKIFHEIKNSVTLISSYLQLLEKKHPEISELCYWDTIGSEITRLRAIVTDLSQIKFGSSLHPEPIDLKDFLAECCNHFHSFEGRDGITCALSLPEPPCIADIDTNQFRYAILNLLKNASEAMGHFGQIQIKLSQSQNNAAISIADSGNGISPDYLPHIFEPFFTTKPEGSGLGLSITSQIISAHQGTVSAECPKEGGTIFRLLLPLAPSCPSKNSGTKIQI